MATRVLNEKLLDSVVHTSRLSLSPQLVLVARVFSDSWLADDVAGPQTAGHHGRNPSGPRKGVPADK